MSSSFSFFKTRIDNYTRAEILSELDSALELSRNTSTKPYFLVTLNPEILLRAQHDGAYREILNTSMRTVNDGMGLHLVYWKMRQCMLSRVTGVEVLEYVLKQAHERCKRVVCLCASDGLTNFSQLQATLVQQYPGIHMSGFDTKVFPDNDLEKWQRDVITQADVILCNFGAPYQEKHIASLIDTIPELHALCMGIGGGFDFITGALPRAPRFLQKMGLEWLWRLYKQPWRWQRIVRALFVFPWEVCWYKCDKSIIHRSKYTTET